MKVAKLRGKNGKGRVVRVVRRAISLPPDLDSQILSVVRETHQPYSTVVKMALDSYVETIKQAELERAYQAYYGAKDRQAADSKLAREFFGASKKAWPD